MVSEVIQSVRTLDAFAREHWQALQIGSEVTRWFRKDREPNVLNVTPENVIAALNAAGIVCVLMGTHGINVYRDQARATQDVDILVTKRDIRKAVRTLKESFPYLETAENSAVVRFIDPVTQKAVIDLMKPTSEGIRIAFRHAVAIGKSHRIPDLEMAIVSKFLAMIAPNRKQSKRLIDAGDLTNMVEHNRKSLDLEKLRRIGDKVQLHGGSKILKLVEEIDAGRPIQLQ